MWRHAIYHGGLKPAQKSRGQGETLMRVVDRGRGGRQPGEVTTREWRFPQGGGCLRNNKGHTKPAQKTSASSVVVVRASSSQKVVWGRAQKPTCFAPKHILAHTNRLKSSRACLRRRKRESAGSARDGSRGLKGAAQKHLPCPRDDAWERNRPAPGEQSTTIRHTWLVRHCQGVPSARLPSPQLLAAKRQRTRRGGRHTRPEETHRGRRAAGAAPGPCVRHPGTQQQSGPRARQRARSLRGAAD